MKTYGPRRNASQRSITAAIGALCTSLLTSVSALELPTPMANGDAAASPNATPRQQELAQFQLPPATPGEVQPAVLPQRIPYQYSIGSESEILYFRDKDLNNSVRDTSLILRPQLKGKFAYRPTDWLTVTLEMIVEKDFAVHEERSIVLPNGNIQTPPQRSASFLINEAYVTIRGATDPFEFNFGRRNYEDPRHWLYDTSLDIASVTVKHEHLRVEVFAGREKTVNLDLHQKEVKDRINTSALIATYRGIENALVTGYMLERNDRSQLEGKPLHLGVGAQGAPTDKFSYWSQLAWVRGKDESLKKLSAYAVDFGGTYRFTDVRFNPSVTLGYAYGTGDDNPNDGTNHEFRQTGLQTNEGRFGGVSKFKVFGEALDPELSNVKILTVGVGFRPAATVFVDLVYHRYLLHKISDSIRNSALTAQMNQDDAQLSRNAGRAMDMVLGFRNLFGIRRLGLDLRAGVFYPGKAFRNENIGSDSTTFRNANKGISATFKFWY
jgi:alginate production protein